MLPLPRFRSVCVSLLFFELHSLCVHTSNLHLFFLLGQICHLMPFFLKQLQSLLCAYRTFARTLGEDCQVPPKTDRKPWFSLTSFPAWSQSFLLHQMDCLLFSILPVATLCLVFTVISLPGKHSSPQIPAIWPISSYPDITHASDPLNSGHHRKQGLGRFYSCILSIELAHFLTHGKWPILF